MALKCMAWGGSSGLAERFMQDISGTMKNTVKDKSLTKMITNTRACGKTTRETEKVTLNMQISLNTKEMS